MTILATAPSDTITVTAGSSHTLNFDINMYDYPDDDGDTFTNMVELENNTNPHNSNDKPIVDVTPPVTTSLPPGGTYTEAKDVELICTDDSDTICVATYYTTDGTDPTTASSIYIDPIKIDTSTILQFFSIDEAGNSETFVTQNYFINIDIEIPTAIVTPPGNTTINNSQAIVVTFSESIDTSTLSLGGSLAAMSDGGVWSTVTNTNDTLTIQPLASWSNGSQILTVDASDMVGNPLVTVNLMYLVDNIYPNAVVTPVNSSTINALQTIVVNFSESMQTTSLQLSGTLAAQSTGGVWSMNAVPNDTLTISPIFLWSAGSQSLTITASDLVSNPVNSINLAYTVDTRSPTSTVEPASGTLILDNQIIVVIFSEPVNPDSLVLGGSMALSSDGGSWSTTFNSNDTLTITALGSWPQGNQDLSINISDLVGNASAPIALTYNILPPYDPNNYQLSGLILYNGASIINRTTKIPTLWVRDETTGQVVTGAVLHYYSSTGNYGINGLPVGPVGVQFSIHVVGVRATLPGNFRVFHTVDLSTTPPNQAIAHDIPIFEVIRLRAPFDNTGLATLNTYPPYSSPVNFSWDPMQGAVNYRVNITKYSHAPYAFIETVLNTTISGTSIPVDLPVSLVDEHYEFTVDAFNSSNQQVGDYLTSYTRGLGWDYRFTVN